MRYIVCTFLFLCSSILASCSNESTTHPPAQQLKHTSYLSIATGGLGGPYFIIGSELAKIYSQSMDMNVSVRSTEGSIENIQLLEEGKADLAFVMSDAASFAYGGKGTLMEKARNIKMISNLYLNYVQIITLKNSHIHKIEDLKGKRVGIGAEGSGVQFNAKTILQAYNIPIKEMKTRNLSYTESIEQLKNGTIDAAFVTSGLPNPIVSNTMDKDKITIVPLSLKAMKNYKKYPYLVSTSIPPNTYGNEKAIETIGIQNILLVRADLPDDEVYKLTSVFFQNINQLRNVHPASEQISNNLIAPSFVIPVHPGAKKWWDERSGSFSHFEGGLSLPSLGYSTY